MSSSGYGKILVIEDNEDIMELVAYNLEANGYEVVRSLDAEDGLRLAFKEKPDLITLDLMLPFMNGLDLLRIFSTDERTRSIPVVILSARSEDKDIIAGIELGASDYITKPFSPSILVCRVRAILRSKRIGVPSLVTEGALLQNPVYASRNFENRVNYCFVLMPFREPWSDRVWKVLQTVISAEGYECKRADDLFGSDVLEDIWKSIYEATVIVADVTGRNPNVLYEVGIAHTLGKNTILLTQDLKSIPFDFLRFRHLNYEDNVDGFSKLSKLLPNFLKEKRNDPMAGSKLTPKAKRSSSTRKKRLT